jgi:hypothetical protein
MVPLNPLAWAIGALLIGIGLGMIVDAGYGSPVINAVGEWIQDLLGTGGNKPAGPGGTSGNAGGGGSNVVNPGTTGGGSGGWGRPSGQPEEREFLEHKGSGSGSGGSGGSGGGGTEGPKSPSQPSSGELGGGMTPPPSPTPTPASKKGAGPKQEQPKQEPPKPEDKKAVPPGTPVATPNPVDGTGEGIDKDWWRGRPHANALEIVAEMRAGLQIDERHGTPRLRLSDSINTHSLVAVLAPQPVSVDERGETVSIDLAGAQSRSTSTGTTTSDGWGDRPRSLAEALAAPRIRVGNIASRF